MRRACPAVLAALSALAACSSAPPPLPPLALGERFAVAYEGTIAPLPPLALPDEAAGDDGAVVALDDVTAGDDAPKRGAPRTDVDSMPDAVAVRLWLVELAPDDADLVALADGAARFGELPAHVRGAHVPPETLVARIEEWIGRGNVLSAPFLTTEVGRPATLRVSRQSSAVAQLRIVGNGGVLAVDPVVASYEHGAQIDLVVRREGDGAHLTIAWAQQELATPRTTAAIDGGRLGSLEVPVALQQRASASVKIAAHDALLIGPLPTTSRGHAQALAIEIDTRKDTQQAPKSPQ
jgi:hypothetical protein